MSEKLEKIKEKLAKAWMKVGKILLWALLAALCGGLCYMLFVHRKVIAAAIKGEPLPEGKGKCCHAPCKKLCKKSKK